MTLQVGQKIQKSRPSRRCKWLSRSPSACFCRRNKLVSSASDHSKQCMRCYDDVFRCFSPPASTSLRQTLVVSPATQLCSGSVHREIASGDTGGGLGSLDCLHFVKNIYFVYLRGRVKERYIDRELIGSEAAGTEPALNGMPVSHATTLHPSACPCLPLELSITVPPPPPLVPCASNWQALL